ncbi:MAG: Exodeoxyribonuclease 7 large subunit [Alphaproteobacteria bacterium MarineAlpha5_Bin11]|nr:MAG: Exodeoxyribonuclease 7 large subunit [Alphaproteobacteria bacterium MarineAlpha5_Bin11]PPR52184.1 MAG: Exodeoxyribonuclease 7 large subunit [Alphaproteobacteria bacterium MarineAlpha5_Bin10]|tara:strand:+ start:6325 stop:7656 length:1332 start_codon:yes stop_codon:yes gene_type:complete
MNLIDNVPEYSVSEFNDIFNETVRSAFGLIKIRGEISNLKKHYSGHIYFNLKDEDSIINSVCWKSNTQRINFNLEEGLEVIATGKITTYAKSISVYQLNIEKIVIAGEGALLKLIEDIKKRLQKKGFFEQNLKKQIPFIPEKIGIITSPTGSVIKDIINRIEERFPKPIDLWAAPVQGKDAAKKIIEGINFFNSKKCNNPPDVIIIARGGGSIEDLMPFNNEQLAETVFHSHIPTISAIGHETDNTILDYVCDLRAATPTAAAEKCVPVRNELLTTLSKVVKNINVANKQNNFNLQQRLDKLSKLLHEPSSVILFYQSKIKNLSDKNELFIKNIISQISHKIYNLSSFIRFPLQKIKNEKLILRKSWLFIEKVISSAIKEKNSNLNSLYRIIKTSSINSNLKKGYTIIEKNKKIISNSKKLKGDDLIKIRFYDSQLMAKIKKI